MPRRRAAPQEQLSRPARVQEPAYQFSSPEKKAPLVKVTYYRAAEQVESDSETVSDMFSDG